MDAQIEQLNCPICMMIFQRPVTISCGHTFCCSCLNNSIRDNKSCPICRQHISYNSNKMKIDEKVNMIIDAYKQNMKKAQQPIKEATNIKCKLQKLILIDVNSDDLLLPYNTIQTTFELQNNMLIDRMQRFVARQQAPFNTFSVICRLVHIQEIRKNLYQGVIEGKSYCSIQQEIVESDINQIMDEDQQEYFYRTCYARQINQSSNINPKEYNSFIHTFYSITEDYLKQIIYKKIDPNIFSYKNDSIAIFYSILGIIDIDDQQRYQLAICFDEDKRLAKIKQFMKRNQNKIKTNPSKMIRISLESGGSGKIFIILLIIFMCMFYFSKSQKAEY